MKSEEELELDDIRDQADQVGKLTPIEYARLRGIQPQLIYYHIRTGAVKTEPCVCGRKVIDVKTVDQTLQEKAQARRQGLQADTRSDTERGHEEVL